MKLLHELIADHAGAFPAKTAAEDVWGKIAYGELEARSASLAAALAAVGVRAGDAVAVYVPYAKEIVLAAVSALKAGGVFVPFDDTYPPERLEYMLENCEAKAILTVRELWEKKKLNYPGNQVIFLNEPAPEDGRPFCSPARTEASPAMLLYTSGTTGKPKGVLHTHGFVLHLVDYLQNHEGAEMNENTRSGVISAFPFVVTLMFVLSPLAKGGAVIIAPDASRKDFGYLYQFLLQARITHIFLPSSIAACMAEDYDLRGIWIFAAGERLRFFRAHNPENFLVNLYGSTEISGVLSKKIWGNEKRITVGKLNPHTKARIVDEEMRAVPPGETGELLISSEYMARQYYRLPELSAGKWTEADGDLWFRTGDRARCTPDGDYDILGRTDNMIKLRGYRIETGEVETQISLAAARLGCGSKQFVVAKKTIGGTEHLCCYYEAEQELDKDGITGEIARYLTAYMIPDVWVRMDKLPRNLNGKVMKHELPQPKREMKGGGPLDSELIARIVWTASEVLEIGEIISPDDSFTELGGTSLTAIQLASRLRDQGIRISSVQILRLGSFRRIAEKADVIWEQLWTPKEYAAVRQGFAERGEHIEKVLPIASWQDEMLFDQILHPDWTGLRNTVILQLDSIVSRADLRQALDILSAENEELRSAIVFHGVTAVQQAITDRKIPLEMIEAKAFGPQAMAEIRDRILHTPLDLQYSSLMQVIAVHVETETFLCVMAHRIAFDRARRRSYLARMMHILESKFPNDVSIRGWREILEMPLAGEQPEKQAAGKTNLAAARETPSEICVYSEVEGPRLVFVHTGNTGSEAYYRLAERIKDRVSFAVIEPFNLYHPDQARYGIRQIAEKYIGILKQYQPHGPYLLGGWCYGGVVAHEMACQLMAVGEDVRHLFLLDAHAMGSKGLVALSRGMHAEISREYFETCPLFAELRANGMLDAMIANAAHVSEDMMAHVPSFYRGPTTYFKPRQIPAGVSEKSRIYWETMMEFSAGNYEHYCLADKLRVIPTPLEHDRMMDEASLDVIAPAILQTVAMPSGADARKSRPDPDGK